MRIEAVGGSRQSSLGTDPQKADGVSRGSFAGLSSDFLCSVVPVELQRSSGLAEFDQLGSIISYLQSRRSLLNVFWISFRPYKANVTGSIPVPPTIWSFQNWKFRIWRERCAFAINCGSLLSQGFRAPSLG